MPRGETAEAVAAGGMRGGRAIAVRLPLSALGHLARVIGGAHTWKEIAALFENAGVRKPGRRGASKRDFLYGVLCGLHGRGNHGAIAGILRAACDPRTAKRGTRDKINRHIGPHGLRFDRDGRPVQVGQPLRQPGADAQEFDQRRYHGLVAERAKATFVRGSYRDAVGEACKALEGLIREKSGVKESGTRLMSRAFGERGPLVVDMPGLAGDTVDSMQCGLMYMCMGIMSGVRNPVTHESEAIFPIGRKDALDILGTISCLVGQVENTSRRPRRAASKRGERRHAGAPEARSAGAGSSGKGTDGGAATSAPARQRAMGRGAARRPG